MTEVSPIRVCVRNYGAWLGVTYRSKLVRETGISG